MSEDAPCGPQVDTVVASLAYHLEAFAATLPEYERYLLAALVESAMDPIQRIGSREGLLDSAEKAFLTRLVSSRTEE